MQEIDHTANPFPGLRPFESTETHLFFGRDGQSEELLRRLRRTHFLAVVGTSGSGKSSLVRAGLLPALQGGLMASAGSDWRIAILRPGGDPIGNLARALESALVLGSRNEKDSDIQAVMAETTLRRSSLGLVELVSRARTKLNDNGEPLFPDYENLLVVVDQFEELFRFKQLIEEETSKEDAAAFVKLLLEAVGQRAEKIYVVLTMRSDFLGDCSQFWELPEAINNGQYLIPRMTRDERREAISGPVAVGQGAISEPLVNQLLNDVGDNPDQLPILQHALMRTWDYWLSHRRNGNPIDIPDYNAIGGMAEALSRHADEAYAELNDSQQAIAEKLFKGLTEKGTDNREIRRPMEVQEICELTGADEAAVIAVIEVFRREGRSFLMPPPTDALTGSSVHLNRESLIDISHESLIRNWERLKKWTEEEAQSARIYKRLSETAILHKRGEEALLKDPALQGALDWRKKNKPNLVWARRYHPEFETALTFLEASVGAREAELQELDRQRKREISYKRTRWTTLIFGLAFILSLASLTFAYSKLSQARSTLTAAQMQRVLAVQAADEATKLKLSAESDARMAEEESMNAKDAQHVALKEKKEAELAKAKAVQQAQVAAKREVIATHAKQLADLEKAEALKAQEQSLHLFYDANLNLTQSEYSAGRFERANRLLQRFSQPLVEQTDNLPRGEAAGQGQDLRGFEWYHLWRAIHSKRSSAIGHKDIVNAVAYSPDGKILATGGADNIVKLWSTETQKEIGSQEDPSNGIAALSFSPDGKILAYSAGGVVKLIDTNDQRTLSTLHLGTAIVPSLAFSPDGRVLATANANQITLWNVSTGSVLANWKGHSGFITSMAYSPDGKVLATGGVDHTVKLWDTGTFRELTTLTGHTGMVSSIAISPDGKTLATGSKDQTVILWDIVTLRRLPSLEGHTDSVSSLAFSLDGKTLAIGSRDGTVDLWDIATRRELATYQTGVVTSLSFSRDGTTLAVGGGDTTVKLLNTASLPMLSTESLEQGVSATSLAFSSDGTTVAVGADGKVKVLNIKGGDKVTLPSDMGTTYSVAVSPDGKYLAAGGQDGGVKLWDATSHKELALANNSGTIRCVAFSQDSKILVAGDIGGEVILIDTTSHKELRKLRMNSAAMSAAFSSDGRLLAVGDHAGFLKVWETSAFKELGAVEDTPIRAVAFSPDGKIIVTGNDDNSVNVWDSNLSSAKPVKLEGHDKRVMSVAFSSDGKTFATSSSGGTVKLWDTRSYQELMTLTNNANDFMPVAFSPDGKTLVVGGRGQIYFWHAATNEEVLAAAQKKSPGE